MKKFQVYATFPKVKKNEEATFLGFNITLFYTNLLKSYFVL